VLVLVRGADRRNAIGAVGNFVALQTFPYTHQVVGRLSYNRTYHCSTVRLAVGSGVVLPLFFGPLEGPALLEGSFEIDWWGAPSGHVSEVAHWQGPVDPSC